MRLIKGQHVGGVRAVHRGQLFQLVGSRFHGISPVSSSSSSHQAWHIHHTLKMVNNTNAATNKKTARSPMAAARIIESLQVDHANARVAVLFRRQRPAGVRLEKVIGRGVKTCG